MKLINDLYDAKQGAPKALDQEGRYPYPMMLAVSENKDTEYPELCRVRVVSPANPTLQTGWLTMAAMTYETPEVPAIGDTVLVWFADGIPENGVYMPIKNLRRQGKVVADHTVDSGRDTPRDRFETVGNDRYLDVANLDQVKAFESVLEATKSIDTKTITETKEAEAAYTLTAPTILLKTPTGTSYLLISDAGIQLFTSGITVWNMQSGSLQMTNVANFSINGKQVATIGAVDSPDGDVLITRGW